MNKLCIVSANYISREGLKLLIECEGFEIIKICKSIDCADFSNFDNDVVVLLDCPTHFERTSNVAKVMDVNPALRCAVLSAAFDYCEMIECFRIGAQGYIVNDIECAPLFASLRLMFLGQRVASDHLIEVLLTASLSPATSQLSYLPLHEDLQGADLSPREAEVIACLTSGMPNKIIARRLDLSDATVKAHVKTILRKLKVENRTQAAIWAADHGFQQDRHPLGMAA